MQILQFWGSYTLNGTPALTATDTSDGTIALTNLPTATLGNTVATITAASSYSGDN